MFARPPPTQSPVALDDRGRNVYDIAERPFSLYEATPTPVDAGEALVRSTHLQVGQVGRAFFGAENLDRLQRRLRQVVARLTGYEIDRQSDEQLMIVMRYVYMQSSTHTGGAAEVARLNELVLREVVPQVGSGLAQYMAYLRDASSLPTPIPRAQATSIRGVRTGTEFRSPF
jgi:hypothetical protein